jgi:Flp pilus assembly protein TadG
MAATEAALALPVLLTLTFAAADFGRIFGTAGELSNAVRAGAESGATHRPTSLTYGSWEARIRSAVLDDLSDSNHIQPSEVSVTVSLATDAQGSRQVQVTGNYVFQTLVKWPLVPNQVTLSARTAMRQYR